MIKHAVFVHNERFSSHQFFKLVRFLLFVASSASLSLQCGQLLALPTRVKFAFVISRSELPRQFGILALNIP